MTTYNLKKSELINIIQGLKTFQTPKIQYEQYITDAITTADIFFHVGFEQRDLDNKIVIDLGCGTGNLTVAAALMGADHVIGVDIDPDALVICQENVQALDLATKVTCIQADLRKEDLQEIISRSWKREAWGEFSSESIVSITNPPFGVKVRGADIIFLKQALKVSSVVYSLHLAHPKGRDFLNQKIVKLGARVDRIFPLSLVLKHTYHFHSQKQKRVTADLYRILPIGE
ncbi:MAG: methyltransferase domain-containing protein [Promethearchaeota archaeon]|nr:MAG: methyltransferase domain-containing protein [Candidatus Lokiarchaeota archaeon]